jgi:hypothetical protein
VKVRRSQVFRAAPVPVQSPPALRRPICSPAIQPWNDWLTLPAPAKHRAVPRLGRPGRAEDDLRGLSVPLRAGKRRLRRETCCPSSETNSALGGARAASRREVGSPRRESVICCRRSLISRSSMRWRPSMAKDKRRAEHRHSERTARNAARQHSGRRGPGGPAPGRTVSFERVVQDFLAGT